jgi:hypothetical protein
LSDGPSSANGADLTVTIDGQDGVSTPLASCLKEVAAFVEGSHLVRFQGWQPRKAVADFSSDSSAVMIQIAAAADAAQMQDHSAECEMR